MITLLLTFGVGSLVGALIATVCDWIETRRACARSPRRIPEDVLLRASRKAAR